MDNYNWYVFRYMIHRYIFVFSHRSQAFNWRKRGPPWTIQFRGFCRWITSKFYDKLANPESCYIMVHHFTPWKSETTNHWTTTDHEVAKFCDVYFTSHVDVTNHCFAPGSRKISTWLCRWSPEHLLVKRLFFLGMGVSENGTMGTNMLRP